MSSEYGEDVWIMDNLILPEHGFYLDLGCAWPGHNSNTEFLRKLGWDGMAIDGNPAYAKDWKGVADFRCAVLGRGTEAVNFLCHDAPDLSRVSREGTIRLTTPLWAFQEALPPIDFISCDLEGHEYEALSGFNWNGPRPQVIISEYDTHGIGEDFRVAEMLRELGYSIVHQTRANLIFKI